MPAEGYENFKPKDETTRVMRNEESTSQTMPATPLGHQFNHLSQLDEPVPKGWLTLEENFILLLISNLPLIASDFISAPHATFNDGDLHIIYIKEGTSKLNLTKFLLSTSTDEYLDFPFVEHIRVKAFRLEPLGSSNNPGGILMVDGEQVPYGAMQGEIRPSAGSILAWNSGN